MNAQVSERMNPQPVFDGTLWEWGTGGWSDEQFVTCEPNHGLAHACPLGDYGDTVTVNDKGLTIGEIHLYRDRDRGWYWVVGAAEVICQAKLK